jgi:hypothetical protein
MQTTVCPRNSEFFYPSTKVNFLKDGSLLIDNGVEASIYNHSFCVDNFYIHTRNTPFVSAFLCNDIPPVISINFNVTSKDAKPRHKHRGCSAALTDLHTFDKRLKLVYSICGMTSLVFLFITLLFYISIPKLNNHQGHIVIANLCTVLIATGLLVRDG